MIRRDACEARLPGRCHSPASPVANVCLSGLYQVGCPRSLQSRWSQCDWLQLHDKLFPLPVSHDPAHDLHVEKHSWAVYRCRHGQSSAAAALLTCAVVRNMHLGPSRRPSASISAAQNWSTVQSEVCIANCCCVRTDRGNSFYTPWYRATDRYVAREMSMHLPTLDARLSQAAPYEVCM